MAAPKSWKDVRTPDGTSREALLRFFGIPPDPESSLDKNIRIKRRTWTERGSKKQGSEAARAVKRTIDAAAEAVKHNVAMPDFGDQGPVEEPVTATLVPIEDLLDHLDSLCIGGNMDGAIEVATKAIEAYPDSWIPPFGLAYATQLSWQAEELKNPGNLVPALQAAERALSMNRGEPRIWSTTAALLGATRNLGRLNQLLTEAESELVVVPHGVIASAARAMVATGDLQNGLSAAVRAVASDPTDLSTRSDLASLIVEAAADQFLPISTRAAMASYEDAVLVAAWCANGVPEAESVVRPHRLWASRARTRVFIGSQVMRTAVGTYTGFLLLPLYNRFRSVPAWRVLWEGPAGKGREQLWTVWSFHSGQPTAWRETEIQHVHEKLYSRLPWAPAVVQGTD